MVGRSRLEFQSAARCDVESEQAIFHQRYFPSLTYYTLYGIDVAIVAVVVLVAAVIVAAAAVVLACASALTLAHHHNLVRGYKAGSNSPGAYSGRIHLRK